MALRAARRQDLIEPLLVELARRLTGLRLAWLGLNRSGRQRIGRLAGKRIAILVDQRLEPDLV